MDEVLTYAELVSCFGLSPEEADAVLIRSGLSGRNGERVVEAARLDEYLGLLDLESDPEK
jgi:hypothetical protein